MEGQPHSDCMKTSYLSNRMPQIRELTGFRERARQKDACRPSAQGKARCFEQEGLHNRAPPLARQVRSPGGAAAAPARGGRGGGRYAVVTMRANDAYHPGTRARIESIL